MIVDCETHCESCKYRGYVYGDEVSCDYIIQTHHSRLYDFDYVKRHDSSKCDKYMQGDTKYKKSKYREEVVGIKRRRKVINRNGFDGII